MSDNEITEETVRADLEVRRQQQVVGCRMNKASDIAERLEGVAKIVRRMAGRPTHPTDPFGLSRDGTKFWYSHDGTHQNVQEITLPTHDEASSVLNDLDEARRRLSSLKIKLRHAKGEFHEDEY